MEPGVATPLFTDFFVKQYVEDQPVDYGDHEGEGGGDVGQDLD